MGFAKAVAKMAGLGIINIPISIATCTALNQDKDTMAKKVNDFKKP